MQYDFRHFRRALKPLKVISRRRSIMHSIFHLPRLKCCITSHSLCIIPLSLQPYHTVTPSLQAYQGTTVIWSHLVQTLSTTMTSSLLLNESGCLGEHRLFLPPSSMQCSFALRLPSLSLARGSFKDSICCLLLDMARSELIACYLGHRYWFIDFITPQPYLIHEHAGYFWRVLPGIWARIEQDK